VRTEKAVETRIKMGYETSKELLDYLKENPDKTIYDMSHDLNWSIGKVQKALHRVENNVEVNQSIEGGRLKKKYRFIFKSSLPDYFMVHPK
jgi:predicted transcriptional regulator